MRGYTPELSPVWKMLQIWELFREHVMRNKHNKWNFTSLWILWFGSFIGSTWETSIRNGNLHPCAFCDLGGFWEHWKNTKHIRNHNNHYGEIYRNIVTINVLSETRQIPVFYTRALFQTTDGKATASGWQKTNSPKPLRGRGTTWRWTKNVTTIH